MPVWKKVKPQKNDSLNLNVTYEDGKLVLPDKANDIQKLGDQLPNLSNSKLNKESLPKNVPGLNTKQGVQEKARTNLSDLSNQIPGTGNRTTDLLDKPDNQLQKNDTYRKVKNYSDSITQRVEKGQAFVEEIKGGVPDLNHIYSSKTLQKLYDSLGISKIDSVMALAASKDEVSKEELLKLVNSSFPSSSLNEISRSTKCFEPI